MTIHDFLMKWKGKRLIYSAAFKINGARASSDWTIVLNGKYDVEFHEVLGMYQYVCYGKCTHPEFGTYDRAYITTMEFNYYQDLLNGCKSLINRRINGVDYVHKQDLIKMN